ncbi:MAG: pyruvate dehydrogenase (acetyl-transferring), homodimeric type, partial [Nocardioidaceae bacterium]
MADDDARDMDPAETREWLDALEDVVREVGRERAWELLASVGQHARDLRVPLPTVVNTPYVNTIPVDEQPEMPGDPELEQRIASWLRWNAAAMVLQANADHSGLGGHISSYASAATLYEVGFNHFWRAPSDEHRGDLVYIQGHSSPGIHARAFIEGRLDEQQLRGFRREVAGGGLPSYPHPWLMPDFWQFSTVSMGLGPIMAINQA